MKLTLPLPPNIANARWHWRTKNRKRDDYFVRCYVWRGDFCDRRPAEPVDPARITATLYVHQKMDLDNLTARLKWALDWMRADGWIADDSPDHLEWAAMPSQVVDRKRPRIEIELEHMQPEPAR